MVLFSRLSDIMVITNIGRHLAILSVTQPCKITTEFKASERPIKDNHPDMKYGEALSLQGKYIKLLIVPKDMLSQHIEDNKTLLIDASMILHISFCF